MIRDDGWLRYCIWEHSATVKELYARRCRLEEEEMTCAAQAAELLTPHVRPGDTVLDVGCGSGYFFHSLRRRGIPAEYFGIDAAPSLVAIGREHLPAYGLPADNLRVLRIEDLDGEADHVVCMNVLSNIDNYHRPLERILRCARKTAVIRESCAAETKYTYVRDEYLDPGCDLKVHVNTYAAAEFAGLIEANGFRVRQVTDRRTQGRPELVIGHPHYWTFFVAERIGRLRQPRGEG
jgi:ubiquinone/menaquinone biosynthesis C-methylase UbiE